MLFVQDNVVGTCNLLDYARRYLPNLEKFINFGTDEVFGSAPDGVEYKEYDRYNSRSPYSVLPKQVQKNYAWPMKIHLACLSTVHTL
jgi:dTDP-D-glucose 4,6-dehydratase